MRSRRKIILLFVGAIIAVAWLGHARLKSFLQKEATVTLMQLTGAEVKLKAVDFKFNGTLLIDDIVIRPKRPKSVDDAIFTAKHVAARFGLLSLLRRDPRLTRVAVNDFVVNAQYDADLAKWNTESLKSLRAIGLSNRIPELQLKSGVIKYSKVISGAVSDIVTMPVDATFKAVDVEGNTLLVTLRGADTASDAPALKGTWRTGQSGKLALTGQLSNAKVPLFENVWNMHDMLISITYDANSISVNECRMRLGDQTSLSAHGCINDYKRIGAFGIEASIQNLYYGPERMPNTFVYSKSLLENLPGTLCQKFFEEYKPKGLIDISIKAAGSLNEPNKTACEGQILCKDVAVVYKAFPYELEHIAGPIDFNNSRIVMHKLAAKHKDVDLVIDGFAKGLPPAWQCDATVTSPNMPLDEDLYNALDNEQKKAWAAAEPAGNIGMNCHFIRDPNGSERMSVAVELKGTNAEYQQLHFPLKNLTGMVYLDPEKAVFQNVISEYEGRTIAISGWTNLKKQQWNWGSEQDSDSYCLSVDAAGLDLQKDIAPIIPPRQAKMLSPLKAGGKVRIVAHLNRNADMCEPESAAIECFGNTVDYQGFPYPLKDIYGKLTLSGDQVEFHNVKARTADANQIMMLNGEAGFAGAAFKGGRFKVDATNIAFDERLKSLLGKAAQDIYQQLAPQGKADINLEDLRITKDGNDVKSLDVQGGITFKNCSFTSGLPITALNGKLNIDASYKGAQTSLKSIAKVDIESVKVKDKFLKRLFADVIYDGSARSLEIKDISADFYGGKFIGSFSLADSNQNGPCYALSAMCYNINLRDFLASGALGDSPDYVSGLMSGSLDVNSQSQQKSGRVQLEISDMKAGKASFFGKLLMVLNLSELKDYVFDKMTITAYLRNSEVIVDQIDLTGNAFALQGKGKVNLEKNTVDLQFIAGGERLTKQPSILKSLAQGLMPAMAKVTVTGDLKNPKVEQTTLPVIGETLEILGMKKCPK